MAFPVSSVNMGFLFPENMVLISRRKMEDDPPRNVTLKFGIFYVNKKDGISFFCKHDVTFWSKTER